MDIASILLGIALLLVVLAFVLRPLGDAPAAAPPLDPTHSEVEALLARREGIMAALLDLDFDHATGKIDDADYDAQRQHLVAAGVVVLKQLDALGVPESASSELPAASLDARIEQAVAGLRQVEHRPADGRAARQGAGYCSQCGTAFEPGDNFCTRCGHALARSPEPA